MRRDKAVDVDVVAVFVSDQDVAGTVERRILGPRARVDQQITITIDETDAGVQVLDHPHVVTLSSGASSMDSRSTVAEARFPAAPPFG